MEPGKSEIILYTTDDGAARVDVRLENNMVWLSLNQIAELFQRDKSTISRHIRNIFADEELSKGQVVADFATTAADGKQYSVDYYNLDMVLAVGYRVKSPRGIQFRRWATGILKEYITKGFALNDEKLKGNGGGNYWNELLDRIRDIRSSEKVMYRQVLDLYATSMDYDPHSSESITFFKMVQNKFHYAAHGHTAAEVIFERANADSPFMGLRSFSGNLPTLKDVKVAKNYLTQNELKVLNNLVSGYFDLAEAKAIRHEPMYMKDYVAQLDAILGATGEKVLVGAGKVSHKQAMDKAVQEYRKYQVKELSPVERAYLQTIQKLDQEAKEGSKKNLP